MAALFRSAVDKVAMQSSYRRFQQDESAFYDALRANDSEAWDYLMIQVHNQFVVPQSRQNYDYDTLISAYTEGLAIVKDNVLSGRFAHNAKVTTYAHSVCRFTLLNLYDKDKRRQEVHSASEQPLADTDEVSATIPNELTDWLLQTEANDHSWALEPLKLAMADLKDRCRTILRLFYVEDMPDREAVKHLNMNEANLRQQRRNCVQRLNQAFDHYKQSYL